MKKSAIVILFPEWEFLGTRQSCIPLYNKCIQNRYLNNGYELVVIRYSGYRNNYTGGIVKIPAQRIIDADITFAEQQTKYADFEKLAKEIARKDYNQIVVSGFHCFDCVEKLAKEVFKLNQNVLVDTDLTDHFNFVSKYYNNWDISTFKPELKLENTIRSFCSASPDLINRVLEKYKHPIWGIPKQYVKCLKKQIIQQKIMQQTSPTKQS